MTKISAQKKINDIGCRETIYKILDLLNGETFNDSMEVLELVKFFIKEHSFVDAELAKSLIDATSEDEDE